MDIQTTKIELIKKLLTIEDKVFLQRLVEFVNLENNDFWDDLSVYEQEEIKKGIENLTSAQRVSYDSFLTKISK